MIVSNYGWFTCNERWWAVVGFFWVRQVVMNGLLVLLDNLWLLVDYFARKEVGLVGSCG